MEKHLVLAFTWMIKKMWDNVIKMWIDILGIVCEDSNIIIVWFNFGSRSVETLGFFLKWRINFHTQNCLHSQNLSREVQGGVGLQSPAVSQADLWNFTVFQHWQWTFHNFFKIYVAVVSISIVIKKLLMWY
jgi:hypothetical protein